MLELESCMQKKTLYQFFVCKFNFGEIFFSKIAAYLLNTCKLEPVLVRYINRFYYNNYHNTLLHILEETVTYGIETHLTEEITDCCFIIDGRNCFNQLVNMK